VSVGIATFPVDANDSVDSWFRPISRLISAARAAEAAAPASAPH